MKGTSDALIQSMIEQYFPPVTHPYHCLEEKIRAHLRPDSVVLEIGCGRSAPMLLSLKGQVRQLIGIDVIPFTVDDPQLDLRSCSVTDMNKIDDDSISVAFSRSVMEHINDVRKAYAEIKRVLKPGGVYIFLTPNFWDYSSLISTVVPNFLHGPIVKATEGRAEEDVFPTHYKSNTSAAIQRLARGSGLSVQSFEYLGQYPNYFRFSPTLFRLGCWYGKFLQRSPRLHALQGWILCILRK